MKTGLGPCIKYNWDVPVKVKLFYKLFSGVTNKSIRSVTQATTTNVPSVPSLLKIGTPIEILSVGVYT